MVDSDASSFVIRCIPVSVSTFPESIPPDSMLPPPGDLDAEEATRILVVDDEPVIRELLADFLSLEGFNVRVAENGSVALAELSKHRYDLVLSDLKMPTMGGIELLDAIAKHTPEVVTVIMTGFGTVETAIDAMKRGAYDYILKPFKVEEVVHTVRRALEKKRLQAENFRLKEALSLYKVSEAIAASLSLEEIITTVRAAMVDDLAADVSVILLSDGVGGYFERAKHVHPRVNLLGDTGTINPLMLSAYVMEGRPIRGHGSRAVGFFSSLPDWTDVESLVGAPLKIRGTTRGFLVGYSLTKHRRFNEGERKLLMTVANRTAAAIENAQLYEDLKSTFRQTIRGLASAIDTMDRYTRGHSERVAAYSQILAIKLGLPPDQVEIVRQSALMHDIGKIGCVLNLNKPGRLTAQEYEVFKKHPGYGKDILEPITFLQPLIPGVHLHHERWDGAGYPIGMRGQQIPIMARIVSVADTYDAMTSDRAYRKALPHDTAVQEIRDCSGSQFDPEVARSFEMAIEQYREDPPSSETDLDII